jgi:hypothetical protein
MVWSLTRFCRFWLRIKTPTMRFGKRKKKKQINLKSFSGLRYRNCLNSPDFRH